MTLDEVIANELARAPRIPDRHRDQVADLLRPATEAGPNSCATPAAA